MPDDSRGLEPLYEPTYLAKATSSERFPQQPEKVNKTSGVDPCFLNLLKNCICKENSPNQDLAYSTRFYLHNKNGFSPNLQTRNVLLCV